MKIIVFQGNFPDKYKKTRHNIGFMLADILCEKHGGNWLEKSKFTAKIAEISIGDEKVILVKPQTFYNETGRSARQLCDFYKIDWSKDFLAVHDDLSLDFGVVRARLSGSDGGNNGLKSLINNLDSNFPRIKIGIANQFLESMNSADFVLANFSGAEQQQIDKIFAICEDFINKFIKNQLENDKKSI